MNSMLQNTGPAAAASAVTAGRDAGMPPATAADEPILRVEGLKTVFFTRSGTVPAVNDVSFEVRRGETLGLVGESGCGKSVTSLSILRLIPARSGRVERGKVMYGDVDLTKLSDEAMRQIRGGDIAMVFQEPMTALNPVLTVGQQIIETILLHEDMTKEQARQRAIDMLRLVHIPEAERQIDNYPHQLSGGMRQRAMIAMALSCNPKVLIADEPTTALDVTIQAQILELMQELQQKLGTAIIMITHDLGVIAETADRVAVMYAGRKVEEADVQDLFDDPIHPYTQGLLQAIPGMDFDADAPRRRLYAIEGTVPALVDLPPGCAFAPRCPKASDICRQLVPPLEEKKPRHWAACWNSPVPVRP
jgi:oligopeptide/dipeptide ABC transporter ATP-binding protein